MQHRCQTGYVDENERGGIFYDRPGVLDSYSTHRHEDIASPNRVMEEPAFLKVLGDPSGKRILDLGCGDGSFAEHLLAAGAESYIGIDASAGMISRAAQQVTDARATFRVGDIEDLAPGAFQVDLVTARMSLHYVADLSGLVARARTWLSPCGRLIFSVVHPVITSHDTTNEGIRTSWIVDDYFVPGPRQRDWCGATVTWYHRTIEQYIVTLLAEGFELSTMSECEPDKIQLREHPEELHRRRRVPLMMVLSGTAR
jgi:ubiquinone/menaquinone biosynthesis C-methylase UbiE